MTIAEAIAEIKSYRPSQYSDEDFLHWISDCDGQIYYDVLEPMQRQDPPAPHWPNPLGTQEDPLFPGPPEESEEPEEMPFTGYDDETDQDTELLVPYPYDRDLYVNFLALKIDEANAEWEKYNQDAELYNAALAAFRNYKNRHVMRGHQRFWW